MDNATIRQFFDPGGLYVYYMTEGRASCEGQVGCDGLRISSSTTPCTTTSRWALHDGACTATSTLETGTTLTIETAISNGNCNGVVCDIDVPLCNVAPDESLTVGSVCWQHVHPDAYNVYDLGAWVNAHPGGSAKITEFAVQGSTAFVFPWHHNMDRWDGRTWSENGSTPQKT